MFCRFLSNTYHFSYDNVKPCCWIKNTPRTQINILDPDIAGKMEKVRQIDEWIPECSYCYDLEKAGTGSPRTIADKEPIFSPEDKIGDVIKIELQIDDDCNAACLMCGTWNSSTWQQYEVKTVKSKELSYRWKTTVDERVEVITNIIDFNKTKQVHFFGGEPFNTDTQLKILKLMKYPENIKLVYVTNGSVFPCYETIALWKKFKNVVVAFSIDGIEEHFDYLRWPLRWDQVKVNLEKYIDLCSNKFVMNTSFTATPFNMFYIERYTKWAEEFSKKTKNNRYPISTWFLNPHPVVGGNMNMSCIPTALQDIIKSKYGENSRIAKLLVPFNKKQCQFMLDYVNFHDGHRKLNWREVFPEITQYFDEIEI